MTRITSLSCMVLLIASGSVHAQATASPGAAVNTAGAQSAAAAIESCNAKMQTLLAALDRHDYAGAEVDFNDTMRAGLTPDQLQQAWESLPQKFGTPGPRGMPHNSASNGYNVITVPMSFQNASLAAQVACGADGKIAGFHVMTLPPPSPAATGSTAAPAHS